MDTRLMGWVDRINRYFLDAIATRRAQPEQLEQPIPPVSRLSPALIEQLARLDLASHDEFVGETLMLWGTLTDGTITAIRETDPDWPAVSTALDQSQRLPVPLDIARLQLLADTNRKTLCLLGEAQSVFATRL